jgi:uncharacterized membrane protein YjfL (UPF0719 family)
MDTLDIAGKHVLVSLGYAAVGLFAFGAAFWLIVKLTPFSIRKEIEEDHNVALAIVLAAVILGVAMIVAATVQG